MMAARWAQVNSRRARRVDARYPASKSAVSLGDGKGFTFMFWTSGDSTGQDRARRRRKLRGTSCAPPISMMHIEGPAVGGRCVAISPQAIEVGGDKKIKCSCDYLRAA